MKYYTGIGSRETPVNILEHMGSIAGGLYDEGWTLRSGSAPGADQAFEHAIADKYINDNGWPCAEIYLPWPTFQKESRSWIHPARTEPQEEAYDIAAEYHPSWKYLKPWVKKLHARNVHQIYGHDVTNPIFSEFVICWTKGAKSGGGTGQAIRIARGLDIPVYDLADDAQQKGLWIHLNGSFII